MRGSIEPRFSRGRLEPRGDDGHLAVFDAPGHSRQRPAPGSDVLRPFRDRHAPSARHADPVEPGLARRLHRRLAFARTARETALVLRRFGLRGQLVVCGKCRLRRSRWASLPHFSHRSSGCFEQARAPAPICSRNGSSSGGQRIERVEDSTRRGQPDRWLGQTIATTKSTPKIARVLTAWTGSSPPWSRASSCPQSLQWMAGILPRSSWG